MFIILITYKYFFVFNILLLIKDDITAYHCYNYLLYTTIEALHLFRSELHLAAISTSSVI